MTILSPSEPWVNHWTLFICFDLSLHDVVRTRIVIGQFCKQTSSKFGPKQTYSWATKTWSNHILKAMQSSSEDVSAATAEVSETTIPENERGEPAAKKLCLKRSYTSECQSDVGECSVTTTTTKLEKRLSTVLCCTVCLDLPISTIYQVFLYIFHNCAYDIWNIVFFYNMQNWLRQCLPVLEQLAVQIQYIIVKCFNYYLSWCKL